MEGKIKAAQKNVSTSIISPTHALRTPRKTPDYTRLSPESIRTPLHRIVLAVGKPCFHLSHPHLGLRVDNRMVLEPGDNLKIILQIP